MYYVVLYCDILYILYITNAGFHKIKVRETAWYASHPLQSLAAGINISVFRSSVSPSWLQEALQRFALPVLNYKEKLLLVGLNHPSGKLRALKDSSLEETKSPSAYLCQWPGVTGIVRAGALSGSSDL